MQKFKTFDTSDPTFLGDRFAAYQCLRLNEPVAPRLVDGEPAYVITLHKDVDGVLREPKMLVNRYRDRLPDHVGSGPASVFYRHTLPRVDPPSHARSRKAFASAFNTKTFRRMRQWITDLIIANTEKLPSNGEIDFLKTFARSVPGEIACRLVHIDPSEGAPFLQNAAVLLAILNQGAVSSKVRDASDAAAALYFDHFDAMISRLKGKLPQDDVAGVLMEMEGAPDGLSHDELLVALINLLVASFHTTTVAMSNAMTYLLRNREQLDRLIEDPSLALSAWDELLRYDAPVHFVPRFASEDTTISGTEIAAESRLLLCLASANRDTERFTNPDSLEISRKVNRHMSFATGIHVCLGAQLSRIEGEIFLGNFFRYFPDISLAEDNVPKIGSLSFPSFERVPVILGSRREQPCVPLVE